MKQQYISSLEDLQREVNSPCTDRLIKLKGTFRLNQLDGNAAVIINKPGLIIDGYDAKIQADLSQLLYADITSIFRLERQGAGTVIRGLTMDITYDGPAIPGRLCAIYVNTGSASVEDCRIVIRSQAPINITGIENDGELNTTLETYADNFKASNNFIQIEALSDTRRETALCGINNRYANSPSLSKNTINIKSTVPSGQIVAIYNSGRFARVYKNAISCSHEDAEGSILSIYNDGMYMLFSKNTVTAQGGRECYGFICNQGHYSKLEDNQISAGNADNASCVLMPAVKCMLFSNKLNGPENNIQPSYGTMIQGNLIANAH